ncbi:MAG TPA: hypothetical protein PKD80_17845 [Microthrixaceae bacterium]|jgi:hypothetical protein|nr:hypothetical protein [Microthrixaceae bacterium]HMT25211.1 hypothetical protein [Microthrixaceae bacterium]HMT60693.1 hypothetical protein [Microthrixaceae bacterium]
MIREAIRTAAQVVRFMLASHRPGIVLLVVVGTVAAAAAAAVAAAAPFAVYPLL